MSATFDSELGRLLGDYPPHPYLPPRDAETYPQEQLTRVEEADGLRLLNQSPAPDTVQTGRPRRNFNEEPQNCHLWVIDDRGLPSVAEAPLERIGPQNLHHTNLTGGEPASVGGELWFITPDELYVNGASGRYPPQSQTHLERAVTLFETAGFRIRSLGWDTEANAPMRFLRE